MDVYEGEKLATAVRTLQKTCKSMKTGSRSPDWLRELWNLYEQHTKYNHLVDQGVPSEFEDHMTAWDVSISLMCQTSSTGTSWELLQ